LTASGGKILSGIKRYAAEGNGALWRGFWKGGGRGAFEAAGDGGGHPLLRERGEEKKKKKKKNIFRVAQTGGSRRRLKTFAASRLAKTRMRATAKAAKQLGYDPI